MHFADKREIATAFSRAVHTYDHMAHLQRDVADSLIQKILKSNPQGRLLDAGCGTGYVSQQLSKHSNCMITALDLSSAMLHKAQSEQSAHEYVQGDMETLPFSDHFFGNAISSLAIQWCHSFELAMMELIRVVRPEGEIYVSTLIEPTLFELKHAWQTIDDAQHVIQFLTEHDLLASMNKIKKTLSIRAIDCHIYEKVLHFDSIIALLKSLQSIGATALPNRRKGLMSRMQLTQLAEAFPRSNNGLLLPLTYQVAEIRIIK